MTHHIIFVNSVLEHYKSGVDLSPTYENSTKKIIIFQSYSSKAYKAGLSIKKKAVQLHDLTVEESVSPEKRIVLKESSDYYSDVRGSIHSSTPVKNRL